jgi:predicted ATP-binding protein involved in virulence
MVSLKEKSPARREESTLIPAVTTDSADLVALIERSLAESVTLSQSLDRTFPKRLLSESANSLPEKELRERLASLEQLRARLTNVGLLDKSDDSALIPEKTFSETAERILTEYVNDAEKKLKVFDSLGSKIELLTQIINKRFQFKTLSVSRSDGFVLTDIRNRKVDLENLSSGEQHELVLVYDLLFSTKQDTLLLIDEPEISLHIAWQKKFLDDLRRIIELTPMDIVLSTHSPQLIGSNLDLAIQLRGPRDGKQPL